MQHPAIREDHRRKKIFVRGQSLRLRMRELLRRGFEQPMRIVVPREKSLQFQRVCRGSASKQNNAGGRALKNAEPPPDSSLHDQVRYVAFGTKQALQLRARNTEEHASCQGATVHQGSPGAEQVQFARKLLLMQRCDGFALPVVALDRK